MNRLAILPLTGLVLLSGCASVVRSTSLRPDFDSVDKTATTRIVIQVQPAPDNKPKVAELWGLMARRYVHLKRQYIVKAHLTGEAEAGAFQAQAVCADARTKVPEGERVDGVLWLQPTVVKANAEGTQFDLGAQGKLLRCSDGQEIWSAEGQGNFGAANKETLVQSWNYAAELGAEVGPYVGPTWELLRPILDTLPDVVLDEAAQEEKVLAE